MLREISKITSAVADAVTPPKKKKADSDEDSSGDSDHTDGGEEENLSDEAVLARHQAVLDDMKEKLEHAMKVRQECIEKKSIQSPTERRLSNR